MLFGERAKSEMKELKKLKIQLNKLACHKAFAMTIQVVYRYLTTQFLGFGKSIFQPSC